MSSSSSRASRSRRRHHGHEDDDDMDARPPQRPGHHHPRHEHGGDTMSGQGGRGRHHGVNHTTEDKHSASSNSSNLHSSAAMSEPDIPVYQLEQDTVSPSDETFYHDSRATSNLYQSQQARPPQNEDIAEELPFECPWNEVKSIVGELRDLDEDALGHIKATLDAAKPVPDEQIPKEPSVFSSRKKRSQRGKVDGDEDIEDGLASKRTSLNPSDAPTQATSVSMDVVDEQQPPTIDLNEPIFQAAEPVEIVDDPMDVDSDNDDDSCNFKDDDDEDSQPGHITPSMKRGVNICTLAEILEQGKAETASIGEHADVVLVIGATGVGKSTFIQSIAGHTIKRGWDKSLNKANYVVDGGGEKGFSIGSGMVSETKYVRSFFRQETSTYFIDSAGFEDTGGIETDIATSICVKEIASRARRIRFVVLINAYTFFLHKASELRKNLDLVANFVGHNFETFKKSFTFLFTHCNDAFAPVRELIHGGSDSGMIIVRGREELHHLLGQSKKGTPDPAIKNLITFLKGCLEHGKPYCDMFDPLYSDVSKIRADVEPSTSKAIDNPKQHVRCSLTSSSKMVLHHEITRRIKSIEDALSESDPSDETLVSLREDALAVCILATHIGENICREPALEVISLLEQATAQVKDEVFKLVRSSAGEDEGEVFDIGKAKQTRRAIDMINYIENLTGECTSRLEGWVNEFEAVHVENHEMYKKLKAVLTQELLECEQEILKVEAYVEGLQDAEGSAIHPNLHLVAKKMNHLGIWSQVFLGEFENTYDDTKKCLLDILKSTLLENCLGVSRRKPAMAGAPILVRGITLLKHLAVLGVLDLLQGTDDGSDERFWKEMYTKIAHKYAEIATAFPGDLEIIISTIFDGSARTAKQGGGVRIYEKLQEFLFRVENTSSIIKQEGLQLSGQPRQTALAIVSVSFLQHCELTDRLITALESDDRACALLQGCFESLKMYGDSLPPSMRAEGGLHSAYKKLHRRLGRQLRGFADSVRAFTAQLDSNGTVDTISLKPTLKALKGCDWFDLVLERSGEEPFVKETVMQTTRSCTDFVSTLVESFDNSVEEVLSGKDSEGTVREICSYIRESLRSLERIANVLELQCAADSVLRFRTKLQNWCGEGMKLAWPPSILDVDFAQMSNIILIASSLKMKDSETSEPIRRLRGRIDDIFTAYRQEIDMIVQSNGDFSTKEKLLSASSVWSKHSTLKELLPSSDELRKRVRKRIIGGAEKLQERISTAEGVTLRDVEADIQILLEATRHLDKHLDGEISSWTNTIIRIMEARKAEIDEIFKNMVETNDFEAIKEYLEKMKSSRDPQAREQYRKALKVLSASLWQLVSVLQSVLENPRSSSRYAAGDLKERCRVLEAADSVLSGTVEKYGSTSSKTTSWSLREELDKIKSGTRDAVERSLTSAVDSVESLDYVGAFAFLKHASLLHELPIPKPRRRIRNPLNANKIQKLFSDVQSQVDEMLPRVTTAVHTFLASLMSSEAASSTTRRRGRNPVMKIRKREADTSRPTFPPDSVFLHEALGQLKLAVADSDCPAQVKECYDKERSTLSKQLNAFYTELEEETRQGKFTRSLKVLTFLQDEMGSRGLKDHLELDFDVVGAIGDIGDQRDQQFKAMKIDLQDSHFVDNLAAKLNQLSGFRFGWYNEDYENYRRVTSNFVQEVIDETKDKIRNLDLNGLRGRFEVIERIQLSFGRHLITRKDPGEVLLVAFKSRAESVLSDMEASIRHNNIYNFQIMFGEFHLLMMEVLQGSEQKAYGPAGKGGLLQNFDAICSQLQMNVHKLVLNLSREFLSSFEKEMTDRTFETAAITAEKLIELGYFLCSGFEAYRHEMSSIRDKEFTDLVDLISRSFASGRVLEIGRSVSVLRLSASAKITDVKRAFKKQSLRWHPDKNPGDAQATERFLKIKAAAELLEDKRNLELYRDCDFPFLVHAILKVPKDFRLTVNDALERNEYSMIASICNQVGEVEAVARLVKDGRRKDLLDLSKIRQDALSAVKKKGYALLHEIKNASTRKDFDELDHAFVALEALEAAFKDQPEVVKESMTSTVLEQMISNLDELAKASTFLVGKDEMYAYQKLDDFGLQLIKIGRFLDGFSRLKKETTAIIHSLLNRVNDEPWGVTFTFKLGLRLENGEISGDDDDKRVGRVIASSFPHFKDVQTVVFNRRVVTADEAEGIEKTRTMRCDKRMHFHEVSIDRKQLKEKYDTYEEIFHESFNEFVCKSHDELVQKVFSIVQELGPVELTKWDRQVKEKLVEIIAGVFATFTIIKSGESFNRFDERSAGEDVGGDSGEEAKAEVTNGMDLVFKPHNIQVIALLRLLGIGTSETTLPNHIMEIRTGEGKSIILGALSVILALLGFSIRCVCYSEHLSERDNELFKDVFVAFNVEGRVTYSKITTMSEDSVAKQGDIRQLTKDLISGAPLTKAPSRKLSKAASLRRSPRDPSKVEASKHETGLTRFESTPAGEGLATSVEHPLKRKASDVDGPLPLNDDEILLVDEVDVFFGPDFYGKTYNQLAELEECLVENLLRRIWKSKPKSKKESLSFSMVKSWPEYKQLLSKYSSWKSLIESEVRSMCADVSHFNEPAYEVDPVNSRIGYTVRDSVDWDVAYGYRTAFAYLHEYEKGKVKEDNLKNALCLRLSCGQFSYARISPSKILGVSGTVEALSKAEKEIVWDFGVDYFTFVPSVYGPNNLTFEVAGMGITIETEKNRHLQAIANQMNAVLRDGRAAIAFFKDDEHLHEFKRSKYWKDFRHVIELSSRTPKDDRNHFIKKAATVNQVTISTAAFGRGTDFFCKDTKLEKNNGLHVIQTFLSLEKTEEIQIKGRTARQGQKGSYSMVLLESDLTEDFGIQPGECSDKARKELYNFLDKKREEAHNAKLAKTGEELAMADERDRQSRAYLDALIAGNRSAAKTRLESVYKSIQSSKRGLKFCRMMCLSDATGSMSSLWSSTKNHIHEMLKRIDELGKGQFELMWVAYRDYSDSRLLEKSRWTKDPTELSSFISGIECDGGGDWREAVEWALKEANDEHERDPITVVLLIADAPPHCEEKGQTLSEHDNRVLSTDYITESKKLKANEVPVYAFRVEDDSTTKESFDRIATITGGVSEYLNLDSSDGAKKLIDTVCGTAIEDIGGSELLAEYRARYG